MEPDKNSGIAFRDTPPAATTRRAEDTGVDTGPRRGTAREVRGVPAVELRGVGIDYGSTTALRDCSFEVARGETLALLGPSGSGKSTALKAIAGFERPSRGRVLLDGVDVTDRSPAKRGLGIVVQSYALFPHMTVRGNVAFGPASRRVAKATIGDRVDAVLRQVGMLGFADRYPRELSGGQQQRVAIARALAVRPAVLLLDEPLSALDAQLRQDMIGELQQLRDDLPDVAIVHVTHDQAEALALADRVAIMRDARLEAIDRTGTLFHRPPTEFVATFLGGADILTGIARGSVAESGAVTVAHGPVTLQAITHGPVRDGDHVALAIRPWAWTFRRSSGDNGLAVRVVGSQWRGSSHRVAAEVLRTGQRLTVDVPVLGDLPARDEQLWVAARPDDVVVVERDTGREGAR